MLVGAAIGTQTPHAWLAFIFGIISHYFFDLMPHWDYLSEKRSIGTNDYVKMLVDLSLGSTMVIMLARSHPASFFVMLIGAFGAILPDCLELARRVFKIKWLLPFWYFHRYIHHFKDLSFKRGIPATIVSSAAALIVLLLL